MTPRAAAVRAAPAEPGRRPEWLSLDNSAKIWPAVLSKRYTTLFRLSVCLDHPVRLEALRQALADLMPRFPYFQAQIHRGVFWYYLVRTDDLPPVEADSANPCLRARLIGRGRWPFRVRAFNRRVSVEFSHMLSDGTGALTFLRALTVRYFERCGVACSPLAGLPRAGEAPDPREWEDSHYASAVAGDARLPRIRPEEDAFRLPHRLLPEGAYGVVSGYLPVDAVLALAKAEGLKLTEYLAAVLLWTLQGLQEEAEGERRRRGRRPAARPIRLNVPVNLRPLFGSATMRNFFSFADPGIDPRLGAYGFGEIAQAVKSQMAFKLDEKRLRLLISRNVRGERPLLARLVPLALKDLLLNQVYRFWGDRRFSTSLSNLGRVELPPELADRVEGWVFLPPPSPVSKVNCSAVTWRGRLCVSFGSLVEDTGLQREFFRFFARKGLPVYIESNRVQGEGDAVLS